MWDSQTELVTTSTSLFSPRTYRRSWNNISRNWLFILQGLIPTGRINESDLFRLDIPEGCVMNKIIQPGNLGYNEDGSPQYRIACCLLKEEIKPD